MKKNYKIYLLVFSLIANQIVFCQCAVTLVATSTNSSCIGCNNGIASVSVSGGTAPYIYSWTNSILPGTANIIATKDNSIYEQSTGNSNGAGEYLVAGETAAGFKNRALMAFDIAGNIPAGASITNASLQLFIYLTSGTTGPQNHLLYKVGQNWGEGASNATQPGQGAAAATNDATWLKNFFPGSDWVSIGGTFEAVESAATTVNAAQSFYNWSSPAMVDDVQVWLNTPSANFGWLLKSEETGPKQAKRYASKENGTFAWRPKLTVNYGPAVIGTTSSVSNLVPGTYSVKVTDALGCISTATITVNDFCPAAVASGKPVFTFAPGSRIRSNRILSVDSAYVFNGKTFVENNATLFIDGGVTTYGVRIANPDSASALIITKTGKIQANGSPETPIVLRGCPVTPANGDWGGLVILGMANINQPTGQLIEGINTTTVPPGVDVTYGTQNSTANDNQNSGVLNYVRVEFAGAAISQANELNGVTFGGVGRGTFIDFVETVYGADDAFEFFGGTVNAKHLIALSPDDDCFDTDFGYTGAIQFGVSVLNPTKLAFSSDPRGFEADNDANSSSLLPRSLPKYSNMTIIGFETQAVATARAVQNGARFRRNTDQITRNSVFMGYPTGIVFDAGGTPGSPASVGNFTNNIVHGFTAAASGATLGVSNTSFVGDPTFSNEQILLVDPFNATFPDFRPGSDPASPALTGANFTGLFGTTTSAANFFQTTTYRGAFSGTVNWNATWSRFLNLP